MHIQVLLGNIGQFAAYFGLSLGLLVLFKFAYAAVTPHDEWKLIKEHKNVAAALGFGGAIVGFALALAGVVSHSVSLLDFLVWGGVALVAQSLAFLLVRAFFMPTIVARIEANETSAGIMLGITSIAVGLLNAACMTY